MRRTLAAGLMSLGLIALGVAATQGQDAEKPAQNDVEVQVSGVVDEGGLVQAGEAVKQGELVEIHLGDDARVIGRGRVELAPRARLALQAGPGGSAVDPQTREQLEKLIAGLKETAEHLEREGKQDEAARKHQSIQMLQMVLSSRSTGPAGGFSVVHFSRPGADSEELKKLQSRRDELAKKLATKADAADDAAVKLKQELADIERAIAAQQFAVQGRMMGGFGAGPMGPQRMPFPGAAPGMPGMPGGMGTMSGMPGMGSMMGSGGFARAGFGHSKSEALSRQADALSQAAAQLKQAGLSDQAGQLADQAEKLRDQAQKIAKEEAEQMRAQGPGGFGGGGIAVFGGGPPGELQRSIKELHEQVQQLRKEVAELRELLQAKRQ